MKHYAEEERLMSQPRKLLISSFTLQNGTLITHPLSFYQAKVNLALGFILQNIEDGGFRYFYAHENHTLLD